MHFSTLECLHYICGVSKLTCVVSMWTEFLIHRSMSLGFPRILERFFRARLLLKGQSRQDLVLLENPMKVLVLIGYPLVVAGLILLKCTVLGTKVVYNCCGYGRIGKKWSKTWKRRPDVFKFDNVTWRKITKNHWPIRDLILCLFVF